MPKYRIGIVGFGKIARDQHAPAIAASDAFELAAVSNIASGSTPDGALSFATVADMLRGVPDLEAVSICTPPGPRRQIAIQCLEAGKHVLLEKPPSATVAEVSDIAVRAKAAGKSVFGTYHAQHNAAVVRAAELLTDKTVIALHVTWKEDLRKWHPGQDWILASGGFGIFDPGINALSILTRILPKPLFVHASTLSFPSNRQAPIAADLIFANGDVVGDCLRAEFDWRWSGPEIWDIDIQTADGLSIKLVNGGSRLEVKGEEPFEGPSNEYLDIYREFARLLASGESNADIAPFQLVADAFMLGDRTEVEAFEF